MITALPKLPPRVSLEQGEEVGHVVRLHLNHLHLEFSLVFVFMLVLTTSDCTHERSAIFPVPLRPENLVLRHVDLTPHREDFTKEQLAGLLEAIFLQHCKQLFV